MDQRWRARPSVSHEGKRDRDGKKGIDCGVVPAHRHLLLSFLKPPHTRLLGRLWQLQTKLQHHYHKTWAVAAVAKRCQVAVTVCVTRLLITVVKKQQQLSRFKLQCKPDLSPNNLNLNQIFPPLSKSIKSFADFSVFLLLWLGVDPWPPAKRVPMNIWFRLDYLSLLFNMACIMKHNVAASNMPPDSSPKESARTCGRAPQFLSERRRWIPCLFAPFHLCSRCCQLDSTSLIDLPFSQPS